MALNKLYAEATRFDPSGRVRLLHVDAQDIEPGDGAIGAGHHYFHYCFVPHTPEDIFAATNQVLPHSAIAGAIATSMTKVDNGDSVTFTSTAADSRFTISTNFSGNTFRRIQVVARWAVTPSPQDTLFSVFYSTPGHGLSGSYYQQVNRTMATTDLGDGWFMLDMDMTNLIAGGSDWVNSQILSVRFDIWDQAVGSLEVKSINFINKDQSDVDQTKLAPKSLFFGGQEYQFWPFEVVGLAMSTGQPPEPNLNISDLGGVITRLSLNHEQLLGSKVEVIDTFAKFLDNGTDPDPTQKRVQEYYIDSQVGRNPGKQITFALSSPADMEGQVVPRRQIMNMCEWALNGKYASGDGCTWNLAKPGIKYYDERGNEVIAMNMDRCGGCLSDCYLRFGQGLADPKAAVLDFGGFPGSRLIKG